jgi:hypothetical protein
MVLKNYLGKLSARFRGCFTPTLSEVDFLVITTSTVAREFFNTIDPKRSLTCVDSITASQQIMNPHPPSGCKGWSSDN